VTLSKQPLFAKGGAKTFLRCGMGTARAAPMLPRSKSLFGSFSSEKERLGSTG
jgi:hypothetical protein